MNWSEVKERLPLDPPQEDIAKAPASLRQLVLAPPGTGKTQIVVARLVHLICEQELRPHEIAVLCFTRAAVGEILSRVIELVEQADLHDDLRFITIRTFDSFATRLLLTGNPDIELGDDGYDGRISRAVKALEGETSPESCLVRQYKHLVVDEIQDLVGIRARLIQELIGRIDGGFTLLGDPAQAIYGWSVAGEAGALDPAGLLRWVRAQTWAESLLEPHIEANHRSDGNLATFGHELRETILSADENYREPLTRLKTIVKDLESAGTARNPDGVLSSLGDGSLCVLCRSNGDVMQVAHFLREEGIDAFTRPSPEDRGLPPWLGRIFGTYIARAIGQTEFSERWDDLVGPGRGPQTKQAWSWLKRIEGEPGGSLDLRLLHHRFLAGHRLPDEADAYLLGNSCEMSVSTIHASKGREFDHVVVLEPSENGKGEPDAPLEEARVLYVATTRAKKTLQRLERTGLPSVWAVDVNNGRKRWVAWIPAGNMYLVEIGLAFDFDPESTVSTWDHPDEAGARSIQEVLWASFEPGSRVNVRQHRRGKYRFYKVHQALPDGSDGPRLGQLSLSFLRDLRLVLGEVVGDRWSYPLYMKGIPVSAVVTEVLPTYPENVHEPFATSRFCLGLRLRGMGYLCRGSAG